MSKDDYFVIVYQVLKYLYECLKDGKTPDKEQFENMSLRLNKDYWYYIIENLSKQGFVEGVYIKKTKDGKLIYYNEIQITPKGIEYLFDNNLMAKAKESLKGLVDVVALFV